jgi:hypothetical protein
MREIMNDLLEQPAMATRAVHWPTGLTYTCDHHAAALRKIAAAMKIHLLIDDCQPGLRQCTNCLNENSIARGDFDS